MSQPIFPLICITKGRDLDLIPSEDYFSKVSTLALIKTSVFDDTFLYDKDGDIWKYRLISEKFRANMWTKFLANTFYNPLLDAKVIWTKIGDYTIIHLKEKLKFCFEMDDDIVTQYANTEIIKSAIDKTNTFEDILKVLNKYLFDVNEKEL